VRLKNRGNIARTSSFSRLTVSFRRSPWCTFFPVLLLGLIPGCVRGAEPAITLQVSSEIAPPGGTAQFKISLTAPALVSTAGISMTFDPAIFGPILNVAAFSATGDQAGYANVNGSQLTASVSSPSASLGQIPDLPIFVVTVQVLQTAAAASTTVTVDPTVSPWLDQQGNTYSVNVNPGTLTIGGSLSIRSVTPGGGFLPSGTVLSMTGTGFDASTVVTVDGVSLASTQFVSPQQINLTLGGGTELTGKHVHIRAGSGAQADFFCSLPSVPANAASAVFPLMPLTTYTNVSWDRPDDSDYQETIFLLNQNLSPVTVTFVSLLSLQTVIVAPSITIPPGELYMVPTSIGIDFFDMVSSAPMRMLEYRVNEGYLGPDSSYVFAPRPLQNLPQNYADPSAATWAWQIGTVVPASINVSILGSFPFTAAVSNAPWLAVSAAQGTAPATLTLTPNVSALGAGLYSGSVTLKTILPPSLSAFEMADITIPVSIQVTASPFVSATGSNYFTATPGSTTQSTGTINVSSTGSPVPFSVSVNASWLSATPTTGTTPGSISIAANPSGLPSGIYRSNLVIQGPVNTVTLPIELAIVPASTGPPQLSANPSSLSFALAAGTNTGPGFGTLVIVQPVTQFTVSVETQSGVNWLTASSACCDQLDVSASAVGLSPGTYLGAITLTSTANGSLTIPVSLLVLTPSVPLTVTPASVALTIQAGQSVTQVFNVTSSPSTLFGYTNGVASSPYTPATVTVNLSATQPGTVYSTVTFSSACGSVKVPIVLNVTASETSLPILASVVNAASGLPSAVAPGEIIALYGTGLGLPPPLITTIPPGAKGGDVIGYTNVLIDGGTVDQIYASSGQVNAIVPFGLGSTGTAAIQVSADLAFPTETWSIPLAASAPGIFTLNGSGVGAGAIVNQDGSINSPTNPASRGTFIQIYATGGGPTSPPSVAGDVALTPASLTLPVTLTIGGVNAEVLYAGNAPGEVVGVVQINAVVPQSLTPGPALPVVMTIGGAASQPGVTVSIQ
jgi:uncharacterized protein (TIGR03437 family)